MLELLIVAMSRLCAGDEFHIDVELMTLVIRRALKSGRKVDSMIADVHEGRLTNECLLKMIDDGLKYKI